MKKRTMALCTVIYLLTVILVFSAISILSTVNTVSIKSSDNGTINLTDIDFNEEIVTIKPGAFFVYSGALYTSEDFASGNIYKEGIQYDPDGYPIGDYGTVRFELKLSSDEVYAIAAMSASFAQRLFIDGKEYAPIGVTSESKSEMVPKSRRYMEFFQPVGDTTEIIIQYSNFVHSNGGGLFSIDLGLARNVAHMEQLQAFRIAAITIALLTAMLFFFGLFLFFQKSRYLLWFSLTCGFIALRGLLTGDKAMMLLLPELDWYLAIRLEYLANCGAAFFSALYLNALFPGVLNRHVMRGFMAFCISNVLFICLTLPIIFTRYVNIFVGGYATMGVYMLLAIIMSAFRKKHSLPLSTMEQALLLCGLGIFVLTTALTVYAHQHANMLFGLDYAQVGMMVFLFINILTLALGFVRTEQELDEARKNEREMEETNRMLERLDKLRTGFLSNISHEMRTPLMVMSGYAHMTSRQIKAGSADEETLENLHTISQEAKRLSRLASGLLRVSADAIWERDKISVATIFEHAVVTSRPILAKNNNHLKISIEESLPLVQVNEDMILQVLLNLIVNANKHTNNGEIILGAEGIKGDEHFAAITVKDNGRGIPPHLLPYVFDRHRSGGGGEGLGLAICKEIVEEHGGRIAIESTLGSGTYVTFTLPLETEEKENEANHSDD